MELKSRQTHMLRRMMVSDQGVALESLIEDFSISKRTLYYDLQKVNEWLLSNKLGYTEIVDSRARAAVKDRDTLDRLLGREGNYYFSIPERRAMEIIYIALNDEPVTISKLIDYFDVSKNTILMDVKEIKGELESWGLELSSTIKGGYQIVGEEAVIRKQLRSQLQKLSNPEGKYATKDLLQRSLERLTQNEIDFFELCRCIIRQYEIDTEGEYILSDIGYESMMMQVSWIRSIKGFEIQVRTDEQFALMKTLSYRSVEISIQKLKVHNIEISPMEVYYIISLFLGIQTTDFLSQKEEDSFITELAGRMIADFERIACLSFLDRERLQRQLTHHIRPMYYRLKYGIPSDNPLADNVKKMYPVVFDFTKRMYMESIRNMPSGISDGELAYLCVYFASNLNEDQITQTVDDEEEEILIIGVENMATATLVKMQIQELLGSGFRYNVIARDKVRSWMLDDYALVVSVGPMQRRVNCDHLVEIGPIITQEDQKKIMDILRRGKMTIRYDQRILDIMEIVERNTDGGIHAQRMYFELLQYFENKKNRKGPDSSSDLFYSKIKGEELGYLPEGADWEMVVLAGADRLAGHSSDSRLRERMKNLMGRGRIQIYRPQKEVLLIHYPMQGDSAGKLDVTIQVSPDGVECPDGKTATIFVGLTTIDKYAHWGILEEIYRYFDLDTHVEGIKELYRIREEKKK